MPTDCAVVASFLVPERADDTWSGAARMLLATLIGYVLASRNCEGSRHLRGVARMTVTGKDISVVLKSLARTEGQLLPRWIVDGFNQYVALEPETRNSAVFNVNMAMNPWNNPLISSATETSDFDLRDFGASAWRCLSPAASPNSSSFVRSSGYFSSRSTIS